MASFGDDVPVRFEEFEFETLLKDDMLTRNMIEFQTQMHAMVQQWYTLQGQVEQLRAENARLSDALDKATSALSLSHATNAHARQSNVESIGATEHGCVDVGLGNSDERDVRFPTTTPGSPQGMALSSDNDSQDTYGSYGVCPRCGKHWYLPDDLNGAECESCYGKH